MVEAFNDEHEKAFAYVKTPSSSASSGVEGDRPARSRRQGREIGHDPVEKIPAACHKGGRKAYFREAGGMVDTPFYLGMPLLYGNKIQGPAVIVRPTTTIAVQPGYTAEVTRYGNYLLLNGNRRAKLNEASEAGVGAGADTDDGERPSTGPAARAVEKPMSSCSKTPAGLDFVGCRPDRAGRGGAVQERRHD